MSKAKDLIDMLEYATTGNIKKLKKEAMDFCDMERA